jgi:hypothetical protein
VKNDSWKGKKNKTFSAKLILVLVTILILSGIFDKKIIKDEK